MKLLIDMIICGFNIACVKYSNNLLQPKSTDNRMIKTAIFQTVYYCNTYNILHSFLEKGFRWSFT